MEYVPTYDPQRQKLVSRNASLERWHPDDPDLPRLRAELVTMRLVEHVAKAVEKTPLNPDQRRRVVQAVYGGLNND